MLFFLNISYTQDFTLTLTAKTENDKLVLKDIPFQKNHKDTISISKELLKINEYLKNNGYFTSYIYQKKNEDKNTTVTYVLNKKVTKATLKILSNNKLLFTNDEIKKKQLTIEINKLSDKIKSLTEILENEGKSFSKINLYNITIKENILYADLIIEESEERNIQKVIVKGYEQFSKGHLKNYFNIDKNTVFSKQKITQISDAVKSLTFVEEIKKPEVLFTKDSTLLYMYLKKAQKNSFDGIVNFTSKEDGKLLFNGTIDLKINNIFNTGERFELLWNSISEEKQEFKLSTEIPYIFKTKISPQLLFEIYKQDSTFVNTKINTKVFYALNNQTKLAITFTNENSESLNAENTNSIEKFNSRFFGLQFEYKIPKKDFFYNDKFYLEINPSIGNRKTSSKNIQQLKIETTISYLLDLNQRSTVYFKNNTGYLNSDNYLDNELFRIGGATTIRGFNEQSIFTNSFNYLNIEYRYATSNKSYIYTITDLGNVKTAFSTKKLLGLGLGYLFTTKSAQINISTAIGKSENSKLDFKESKLIINWKSYF